VVTTAAAAAAAEAAVATKTTTVAAAHLVQPQISDGFSVQLITLQTLPH